jgi:transposase
VEALGQIKDPLAVCFEASTGYGPLFEALGAVADRVVVAHPGRLRLIFRSKRKNDRVDAEKLAQLLLLDLVPAVHVPSAQVRAWRRAIQTRRRLVQERTRAKNGLRGLLRDVGVQAPKGLWTRRGVAWLSDVTLPDPMDSLRRDFLLARLSELTAQIRLFERRLDAIGRSHVGVSLLRTIPGVGMRTAEAVVAYLDCPERFVRAKAVGCYFGLVPCQDASADRNHLGHITREGPSVVRGLLTEASWQGIRRSPTIRAYFERIQQDNPDRKKIALTATGHYLIRVMYAMLRTGETWREAAA